MKYSISIYTLFDLPIIEALEKLINHGLNDEHLQIGEGTIPFQSLFSNLPNRELEFVFETNTVERAEYSKVRVDDFMYRLR